MNWIREHRILLAMCAIAALLALIPVFNIWRVLGAQWQGVIPSYGDEILYYNQVHEVVDGNFWYGNQYLLEHSKGPPLVIFAGHWLAAIPMLLGVPFVPALVFNFILWSMIFVGLGYWLFREFELPKWLSAAGAMGAYLTVYGLVFRPSSRQEVFPFFILFYIALLRFLKRPQAASSIIFLGIATGATFYVFSYLWQTAVITLGLLALFAVVRKEWVLLRSTLLASALGGAIGLPSLLYMLYLSKAYPYFLESVSRFGLVNTHLPMAEVVYSGGWIGVLVVFLVLILWRVPALRIQPRFLFIAFYIAVTGLGLWIMQGSNLVTGKLLETGEHMRPFIAPWIVFASVPVFAYLWSKRQALSAPLRAACVATALLLACAALVFVRIYLFYFIDVGQNRSAWVEQQGYAAPLQWLDQQEKEPVVIWTDPHLYITEHVPSLSKHYVLFATEALFTLTPNDEIRERYLVANYFNTLTVESLKEDLPTYVGRQDAYHHAKTIERGIKICRILFFWDSARDCGVPPTSAELLGEPFFNSLEQKFVNDIKPHIKEYLKKYHVSYIVKDVINNPQWQPTTLGAVLVWSDGRYDIYRLQ